ncbi:divalent-cation tolerance protein CutA [Leptospira sp. GIMC2001]|uniref:divalent-cation tolerance protein CutA n=1 Tax=Leptospira sp. GIMC2001 TaxID=1513297 RepID=UPI00234A3739|nr:divalent-cation tolerance protein CutA [Leptospira sp. GIMC2001]WCL47655.1 divalent-cation tolerance protein CutA [Leptospira sp. GIMC2001]
MKEYIVYTAINDRDWADEFVSTLLEQKLIASATFFPDVEVMYMWDGHLTVDKEFKLMMKTYEDKIPAIEEMIASKHPYIAPEIIAIEASFGSAEFRLKVTDKINKNQ